MRAIYRGKDGFLSGDVKGKLFIEMSTLQPMTGARAGAGRRGGRRAADRLAGVRHHPACASSGKLYAMVGGKAEDIERARPVLEKLAHKIAHMGPNGAGYAMKLAVNLGLAAFIQATAELLALGTREGLSVETDARRARARRRPPTAGSPARKAR